MINQNNLLQLEEVVELAKSADDSDRHFFEQTIQDTGTEKVKLIQNHFFANFLQPIFVRQTTEKLREKSKGLIRALSEKKVIKKQTSTSTEKNNKPKKGIFARVSNELQPELNLKFRYIFN